ncbi:hypothetical protein [Hyphomicrobium sp. 99]|uniref:hypothetical protein n=1 Tax=Hyphomicrobium sp. 99 TaxID=1163419 RepID=UPI0012E0C11B|nr:hypothetical protein [Hyphomicrobium sp. 99]
MSKTNYTDPTNATDPPGGKHHETNKEGMKLPTERPSAKGEKDAKKSVSPETASKTER